MSMIFESHPLQEEMRPSASPIPKAAPVLSMWFFLITSWVALAVPVAVVWMIPGAILALAGLVMALACIRRMEYFHGVLGIIAFLAGGGIALVIHFSLLAYYTHAASPPA